VTTILLLIFNLTIFEWSIFLKNAQNTLWPTANLLLTITIPQKNLNVKKVLEV